MWGNLLMSREIEILERLNRIKAEIPSHVTLIVVTKTYPVDDIDILYRAGIRDFGENRDHEGASKSVHLPLDINWHFQGQIQSNKLKSILSWATYIHSLDDLDHAKKANRILVKPKDFFVQVNLDGRPHRGGVAPDSLPNFIDEVIELPMVNLVGLMAVAPQEIEPNRAFETLAEIRSRISSEFPQIKYLSAGMSGDYREAIAHGATHVRIGSSILGSRG